MDFSLLRWSCISLWHRHIQGILMSPDLCLFCRGADWLLEDGFGQQWPKVGCEFMLNDSYAVYVRKTYSELSISAMDGLDCTMCSKDFRCCLTHNWIWHADSTTLIFLLSFMPLRLFQRWPDCILDLDVFNVLYGEMGPPTRWYALLCPSKTVLCQWW